MEGNSKTFITFYVLENVLQIENELEYKTLLIPFPLGASIEYRNKKQYKEKKR